MQRSLISAAVLTLIVLAAAPAEASKKAKPAKQPNPDSAATHSDAPSATAPATTLAASAATETTTELPRNARPTHYSVSLKPDFVSASFTGHAAIKLQVTHPTSSLTLNAVDLNFSGAQIIAAAGEQMRQASAIKVDAARQTVTVEFAEPLAVGAYQLALDYSGKINSQPSGLFYLDYDTTAGRKRALYTQFEAADARRVFPCWDEPAYRATFSLDATVPAGMTAISNMPATVREDSGNTSHVSFATTPRMSTYLLFFGVGDFERASRRAGATDVGVVTVRGRLPQAQFVLDSSVAALKEYNGYFGLPYPLPKLDNVAAPGSSQTFAAMENWGAIFSFESSLLLDPAIATQKDRQWTFVAGAHEIAHQWFGDLVTMRWWDDLWLNEGFATWMESRTTAKLHPEWQTALSGLAARDNSIERDALATTHPVVQHLTSVRQAESSFDDITYGKGAAVIQMLENYVGADAWRNGVRSYIKENAYGNAVSDQLWAHIEKAAHKPVTAIAHDFTQQPGVPLLRVESQACQGGRTQVTLTQEEYSKDQPNKQPLSWRVPVLAQTVGAKEPVRALVAGGKATLTLPGCGPVLVNAGQAGYYRVQYAPAAYKALADGFAQLAPVDQLGFMSDTWALGLAGRQPASDFLALAKAAPADAPPQIWEKVADVMDALKLYARGNAARTQQVSSFGIARLSPVLARVGWEARAGEAPPVSILREHLILTLSNLGDPAVVAEARRRYEASRAGDAAAVPAALRRTVLAVVARHADAAAWEQLQTAARAETSFIVKSDLYTLLGAANDPALAQRALQLAISGEPALTIAASIIRAVAREHSELAFDFALANLGRVNAIVEPSARPVFFSRVAGDSTEAATIARLQAYAEANVEPDARAPVATAASRIQFRVDAIRARMPEVEAWLAQNGQ